MIRRALIFVVFCVSSLWGQFVTITGNVTDPVSGQPYQNATGRATLISGNGQSSSWTIGGVNPVRTPIVVNLDSFGNFTTSLTNTCLIDQQTAQPVWQFSWTSAEYQNVGTVSFTGPTLALCSSQSITQQITNVPPAPLPITPPGGGGGGTGPGAFITNFTAATTVSVLGLTHRLNTKGINVTCFDNAYPANFFEPGSYTIDTSFNVLISFMTPKTGYCALIAGGGGGTGGGSSGTAGGDLAGSYPNPTVSGLRGIPVPTVAAGYLHFNGSAFVWDVPSGTGGGTVSSVGLTAPTSMFTVTGSPVTSSGNLNLTFQNQLPNLFLAGPVSGAAIVPTFRTIAAADLPVTGNTSKVVSTAGLTGPNGTGVCEDGAGNLKDTACQGTYYAQKYCNTLGTLDDSCITNALAALPPNGGVVLLGYGAYQLANTVIITHPVILQGVGASTNCTQTGCTIEPPWLPGTTLNWVGPTNAPMLFITPNGSNQAVGGVNLRNITLDGTSVTGVTAIDANCMQFSQWDSVSISHTTNGIILGCRTGTNSMLNTFTQTDMNLVSTGLILDGPFDGACSTTCGDAFNNTFVRLHINYTGTAGVDIKSADNNQFMDLNVYRTSGTGYGIIFEAPSGSGTTARVGGTYTYIYHLQSTTSPTGHEALFNAGGNVIREWDVANGQASPNWTGSPNHNFVTVTSGNSTAFVSDTGGIYIVDPNPSDANPGKGFVVNNGHLQFMSNNHANVLFDMDDFGTTSIANGTNVVYRCVVAGTLPVGALTISTGNCGTAVDTLMRIR